MSTTSSTFSCHILSVIIPVSGHLNPFIALASKIVQLRPDILMTIHTVPQCETRIEEEFKKYFQQDQEILRSNIRITSVEDGEFENYTVSESPYRIAHGFESLYQKLANCQPIVCPTGRTYPAAHVAPTVAIIDLTLPNVAQSIRDSSGRNVRIMGWCPANMACYLRITGPLRLGGFGDASARVRALALETGRPKAELEDEVYFPDTPIAVPGLPLMYGYEYAPREPMFVPIAGAPWIDATQRFIELCDGTISTTSMAYEAESVHAWRDWLSQTNRKLYVVGPVALLSRPANDIHDDKVTTSTEEKTGSDIEQKNYISFLDEALKKHGKHSLFYIAFGSLVWPKDEYVWMLVDILLECGIPFILSHASPMASIPPNVSAKIRASGLGLLSPYAPQRLILKHPATGWFVTHCGQNSVMEALSEGIPMIAWPLESDGPIGAARLTAMLDVAFELIEVRTGKHGRKPRLHSGVVPVGTDEALRKEMRGIVKDATGTVGERKRKNVHKIRDAMKTAWDEGGDALAELKNFLKDMC